MINKCPTCGSTILEDYKFCIHCGSTTGPAQAPLASSIDLPNHASNTDSTYNIGYTASSTGDQTQQMQSTMSPPASHVSSTNGQSQFYQEEITRYLSAAAYIDDEFSQFVLDHILDDEIHDGGETYGINVLPLARWAKASQARMLLRDIAIIIVPFITWLGGTQLLFSPFPFPNKLLLYMLFSLAFFIISFFLFRKVITTWVIRRDWLSLVIGLLTAPLTSSWLFFGWIIILIEEFYCYFGTQAHQLLRGQFQAEKGGTPLTPEEEALLTRRFPLKERNIIAYSGYSPFAGAGYLIRKWSFVVDTDKKVDSAKAVDAITATELYQEMAKNIQQLNLPRLSIGDKLYAHGSELRSRKWILPDPYAPPITNVESVENDHFDPISHFKEAPEETLRYYQCVKVVSWKGNLTLSLLLRVHLVGKNLFVEANYCLLPPLKEHFYDIDIIGANFTSDRAWALIKSSWQQDVFSSIIRTPLRLSRRMQRSLRYESRRPALRKEIQANNVFNYGTETSIRRFASADATNLHFQWTDAWMQLQFIEAEVLKSITTFLEEHNIDTGQFLEDRRTIINSGTVLNGGTFTADAMSFGPDSSIQVQQ